MARRGLSRFFQLEGEVMIDSRTDRYCTYVEFLVAIDNFLEKLKFAYVGYEISTECTFGSATFCIFFS